MKRKTFLCALLSVPALVLMTFAAAPEKPDRAAAWKLMNDGNFKEAFDGFSALALDPADDQVQVGSDLAQAVECLRRLNRVGEFDAFIEKVILAHKDNGLLLFAAAEDYRVVDHQGSIVAGSFVRGPHRGGTARYVSAYERDRVRALQLMVQAMGAEKAEKLGGQFYFSLANMLLGNRGYGEAWRLQYLTDLDKLPDYEEGYYFGGGRGIGAPVNADGTPVYYPVPQSWKAAQNDGERWRWALHMAAEIAPAMTAQAEMTFADFLRSQFGTETLAEYRWFFGRATGDNTRKDESGTYALHTLGEDETIARLATGIKRFKLPDEFNYILIYQHVADEKAGNWTEQALTKLADLFENRRQYEKSAGYWRRSIALGDPQGWKQKRLDQIEGNWGRFEPIGTQPAGPVGATVEFRFRNGSKVSFEAQEINVQKLLNDVKAYLKDPPKQLDWNEMNIADIGARLVRENQSKYLLKQVAAWDLELKPREHHFDRRITVATPLQRAGAYLLSAKMEGGNTSYIVMWVADTAIVRKPMDKQIYCFVADAVTGRPISKAHVVFFGYRQEWVNDPITRAGRPVVYTADSAEFTDADGQVTDAPKVESGAGQYQWVIIATTPEGRLAYLGFTGFWPTDREDAEYKEDKVFAITDRPVYRPSQPVKFKFWLDHAQYDQEGKSAFAGQSFTVEVRDPRDETVFRKGFTADDYGGFDGELTLSKDATLGEYQINVLKLKDQEMGGGSFRVEEYKKPEFEVKVKAPEEPVMLGEKFSASIEAKYYFGAPVTEAKVKYKILRTGYSADWYPMGLWDWFYEPGYWWFASDYTWYPGWRDWGCKRPAFIWRPFRRPERPELVAEVETVIGRDGVVKVEIDTALAKEIHGDMDHKYEITAEVTDPSRRTIVGQGSVLVARQPFKVYAWVDRGHYRVGDTVRASFKAQTLDGKRVQGPGELRLLRISYGKDARPVETEVQSWKLDTDAQGSAEVQIKAEKGGQYRLSFKVTDAKQHVIEGGYVFCVMGEGAAPGDFRFNDIELVTDRREYAPGDKVNLLVNTARADSWIVLFLRPSDGMYSMPKIVHAEGKSTQEVIEVAQKDMPNFFVEAFTVADGRVYTETREVIVPPESRILGVTVEPSAEKYKPGEKAVVKLKLTGPDGKPFVGSTVVSIYDKAVEYVSGGSNVPDIKAFFWKWRREHHPNAESSLDHGGYNLFRPKDVGMEFLGIFGQSVVEEVNEEADQASAMSIEKRAELMAPGGSGGSLNRFGMAQGGAPMAAPMAMENLASAGEGRREVAAKASLDEEQKDKKGAGGEGAMVEPTVRTEFADTALWVGCLATDKDGLAQVELKMPENLTTWKARVWAMGAGTRVGEGAAEVVTAKNLILRLQAPRFFVEKDEVVLSANVHNYLKEKKQVRVSLELPGDCLSPMSDSLTQTVEIEPGSEKRVDWRVKAVKAGEATIRMKALTDEESDAMEMKFPVYVHGMLKTESFSGVIRPEKESALVAFRVPAERRAEQTRLEVRWSPTLAGAMVDALPYLADYPYGCTEQTLDRFLPTVVTQKVLLQMGLDLKEIQQKRTNLNAQQIGDDQKRAADWSYSGGTMSRATARVKEPVFDPAALHEMVKDGISRLAGMQCSDGGWGWFSGWGEQSWPHTTAYVVHGLQIARACDVALLPGMIERGVDWLQRYQAEQNQLLRNAEKKEKGILWKERADNLDAFVYMVLADEGAKYDNLEMRGYLYRDRNGLAVYAKAMFGLALHKLGDAEKRDMLLRNIDQFLVQDDENQTAYLNLPADNWWWCWYGSEYEAQAYYLKLLAAVEPKSEKASRLVKYLINNRRHATYWNSTRDTAVCVEAFADYLKASGEDKPDMTVTILLDGKAQKEVRITPKDIFSFDNKLVLEGRALADGKHTIEFVKKGAGPLYFNAYLTNFTLEDPITAAGLEIKVQRKYYQLVEAAKTVKAEGSRGQAVDQRAEKYERRELANLAMLKSGDLVEVELEIESKNDYEYIVIEDAKAAGFEPVDLRSGYNGNDMGAYVEFRDERTVFFVRDLARGKHSVSYRMRAEVPGKFSALPTKASAMYAPELKANADEIKLQVED
ncbi:MAG: alpha-2-macroglobulin family protein [Candidatus Brocadiia bacterium]